MHTCCRIPGTECLQRHEPWLCISTNINCLTYSSLPNRIFVKKVCSNHGQNMCDQKLGSFFSLSCDTRNLLSSIIPYNMTEEILFLRVLLIIWFLLDRNALRFSLHRWPILMLGKYSKPGGEIFLYMYCFGYPDSIFPS